MKIWRENKDRIELNEFEGDYNFGRKFCSNDANGTPIAFMRKLCYGKMVLPRNSGTLLTLGTVKVLCRSAARLLILYYSS